MTRAVYFKRVSVFSTSEGASPEARLRSHRAVQTIHPGIVVRHLSQKFSWYCAPPIFIPRDPRPFFPSSLRVLASHSCLYSPSLCVSPSEGLWTAARRIPILTCLSILPTRTPTRLRQSVSALRLTRLIRRPHLLTRAIRAWTTPTRMGRTARTNPSMAAEGMTGERTLLGIVSAASFMIAVRF